MSTASRFRVFISAVSSEFETARGENASDLRSRGIEVKFQKDFRQEADADTTLRKLHDYIRDCSAVVCVIGQRSGSVPPPAAAEPFQHIRPDGLDPPSYTQWELLFPRHYRKRLSIYVADPEYEPDRPEPGDADDPELQARFVHYLFKELGLDRTGFLTTDQLGRRVLREEWPQVREHKPILLPYASLGELFKGREGVLEDLHQSLKGDGKATAIVGKAIHGLGGVGKTRLAVEYAWRHVDDYDAIFLISAETPEILRQNLAGLTDGEVLNLPEQKSPDESGRVPPTQLLRPKCMNAGIRGVAPPASRFPQRCHTPAGGDHDRDSSSLCPCLGRGNAARCAAAVLDHGRADGWHLVIEREPESGPT